MGIINNGSILCPVIFSANALVQGGLQISIIRALYLLLLIPADRFCFEAHFGQLFGVLWC